MDDELEDYEEEEYNAEELRAAQREEALLEEAEEAEAEEEEAGEISGAPGKRPLSLMGTAFMVLFIFTFFDLPQYVVDYLSMGTLSLVINWIIAAGGWIIIYLWLAMNGRKFIHPDRPARTFGFMLADLIPLVPGLSGFIISYYLRERVAERTPKVLGNALQT